MQQSAEKSHHGAGIFKKQTASKALLNCTFQTKNDRKMAYWAKLACKIAPRGWGF